MNLFRTNEVLNTKMDESIDTPYLYRNEAALDENDLWEKLEKSK